MELRRILQRLYGPRLQRLVLFGSQARGDANQESDVDVLVVLEGQVSAAEEIERTGQAATELSLKHGIALSCVFVSADRFVRENSPLLLNVRREGVRV
jgi:predicted nucleotidyltransferase